MRLFTSLLLPIRNVPCAATWRCWSGARGALRRAKACVCGICGTSKCAHEVQCFYRSVQKHWHLVLGNLKAGSRAHVYEMKQHNCVSV